MYSPVRCAIPIVRVVSFSIRRLIFPSIDATRIQQVLLRRLSFFYWLSFFEVSSFDGGGCSRGKFTMEIGNLARLGHRWFVRDQFHVIEISRNSMESLAVSRKHGSRERLVSSWNAECWNVEIRCWNVEIRCWNVETKCWNVEMLKWNKTDIFRLNDKYGKKRKRKEARIRSSTWTFSPYIRSSRRSM